MATRNIKAKKKEQAMEKSLPANKQQQAQVVKKLITQATEKLVAKDSSWTASLADYVKLVQLQNDLEEDLPRDIKVGWVDHLEKSEEE